MSRSGLFLTVNFGVYQSNNLQFQGSDPP